jgi:hypothetical protein
MTNVLVSITNLKQDVTYELQVYNTNSSLLTWSNMPTTAWISGAAPQLSTNGWSTVFFRKEGTTGLTNAWEVAAQRALAFDGIITAHTNATTITISNSIQAVQWKYTVQTPAITTSNIVFSFNTNTYECVGLTNLVLTNLVEEASGIAADAKILVRATSVDVPLVWPAYGAQHGYFFRTNANNPILQWAKVTNGTTAVISLSCVGTNIFGTITGWP